MTRRGCDGAPPWRDEPRPRARILTCAECGPLAAGRRGTLARLPGGVTLSMSRRPTAPLSKLTRIWSSSA